MSTCPHSEEERRADTQGGCTICLRAERIRLAVRLGQVEADRDRLRGLLCECLGHPLPFGLCRRIGSALAGGGEG